MVDDWCTDNKMELNKNKCGILQYSKRGNNLSTKEK